MSALPKAGASASIWNYSTGETYLYLIGAVIEGATHKPLATYLSETLWSRLGMEQDATWWLESPGGLGLAGSGIGATLRDYRGRRVTESAPLLVPVSSDPDDDGPNDDPPAQQLAARTLNAQ